MFVICIDVSPMGSIKGHRGLTLNKRYEVLLEGSLHFEIINDYGERCRYRSIRFISLEEFRDIKLDELLGYGNFLPK